MKFIQHFLIAVILISILFSCKDYDSDNLPDNNFRIKKILELNEYGEESIVHSFTYENDKIILWRSHSRNEKDELREIIKVEVSYDGNSMSALQFQKVNNEWEKHQGCIFTIQNDRICEKLVSRYSSPECRNCWKYQYKYIGARLEESKKYFCNGSDDWKLLNKQFYTYEDNSLSQYENFMVTEDGKPELDYLRLYSIENNKVSGWEGGVVVKDSDWQPAEKKEFVYEQGLMSSETYSVWDEQNKRWQFFGSVGYYYDINTNLVEEITSNGNSIRYEYENGRGNASLLYCDPIENSEPVPTLKSKMAGIAFR